MKKKVECEIPICDFCGKEIHGDNRPFSITVSCNDSIVFEYGCSRYDWDLCSECAVKLNRVFFERMEGYIPERYTFDNYEYRDKCKDNVKKMIANFESEY